MARILLADDDQAMRDVVARALGSDGHSVIVTSDGLEAADRLGSGPNDFDAIVADVQMPGLDGIGLAEKVLATHPNMRFVLMSGLAGALVPAERLKSAKFRLLSKPFTLEQIRAEVRAVLA